MSISTAKWCFPDNGGGLAAGFNDSSIDTFKGQRLSALVREVIQNSLDARLNETNPVVVSFIVKAISKEVAKEICTLAPHLEMAKITAQTQNLEHAVDFYDGAIKLINEQDEVNFLCIHDSNTSGLIGPIGGPNGAWFALTKGSGLSQKVSSSSLGSFGHGSKAPFANSMVRSVFYYTKIYQNEAYEYRFQGKSILQSYNTSQTKMTQGTGFFGQEDGCLPLLNDETPDWVEKVREEFSTDVGTSIYVPYTSFSSKSYPSIVITSIANFYYAIKKGRLVVIIGEREELNSTNIDEKYQLHKNKLDASFDEVDKGHIVDCFKSIETIVNHSNMGQQEIPNFGTIDWYIRMNEDVDWRSVAVARENGMLITRSAILLERFPNLKPFDLFVCVTGNGSETLKTIENPEHNNFQFDRIDNLDKRKVARSKYNLFAAAVRELAKRFAEYSSSDKVTIDELRDLFSESLENIEEKKGKSERGSSLFIENSKHLVKSKTKSTHKSKPQRVPNDTPILKPKTEIIGPSIPRPDKKSRRLISLDNLRMRTVQGNQAYIYFDAPITGTASIKFKKSGETGTESLNVLNDEKSVEGLEIKLIKGQRESLLITFAEKEIDFALEVEAYEINN